MLSDYAKEDGDGAKERPKVAIEVKATTVDPVVAMTKFIKAVHANDAHEAYDAYCLLHEAHDDEMEKAGAEDDGEDEGE